MKNGYQTPSFLALAVVRGASLLDLVLVLSSTAFLGRFLGAYVVDVALTSRTLALAPALAIELRAEGGGRRSRGRNGRRGRGGNRRRGRRRCDQRDGHRRGPRRCAERGDGENDVEPGTTEVREGVRSTHQQLRQQ